MYLVGFAAAWWLGRLRASRPGALISPPQMDDLLFYAALGVIVGGRLGYTLFYGFDGWLADPLSLLRIWEGGMSFHGGALGVIVLAFVFTARHKIPKISAGDLLALGIAPGLLLGRMANFINAELWGRPTDLPWGMVFPFVDDQPRHPSMLYEALLEGLVLFVVLWLYSSKPRPTRAVSGMFLLCYGVFRFGVEFVREPDAHIGYLAMQWLTMGHLLCHILEKWMVGADG